MRPQYADSRYASCIGREVLRSILFSSVCRRSLMNRRTTLLGGLVLPLLASCRSVDTEQTTTINAVVETVDPTLRELLLRGSGGAQSGALQSMIVGQRVQ